MSEILPQQLNYKLDDKPSPVYKYLRIPLNNINTSVIPLTDAQQLLEFKLPSTSTYNLKRSSIGYNHLIPAGGAGVFNNTFEDVFTLGSDIYFGTAGGVDMCNLKFANNYTKVASKMNTPLKEFLTNDYTSQLYPCNREVDDNRHPPYTGGAEHQIGNINYIEPRYMTTQPVNELFSNSVNYPLKNFANTTFSYDKDLYFGNEMYIRIMTNPLNKMAWRTTSAVNPSTGVTLIPAASLRNVYLWLAVEQNDRICNSIISKFDSGHFKVNIPYTVGFTNSSASTVANVNVQITKQYGKRLLQIVHSVFNSVNTANFAYDCDNKEGLKVKSYRTQLDSKYLQDYDMSCLDDDIATGMIGNDDWYLANRKFCKDTSILNKNVYGYNWFHCDRFYDDDEDRDDVDNLDVGLPLTTNTINWTFNSVTSGIPLTHHTWLTFRRSFTITKDGVIIDVE